jgi:phosphohistidine phosphatase SixA
VLVPRAFQVISSPATRARTTAEIFQDELKVSAPLLIWDELGPGASAEESFRRWPELVDLGRPWVMVGHEPTLSELAGFAISGQSESIVRIGRAGAALLVFDGPTRPGGARLGWLLTAEQLSVFRNAPLLEPESR